MSAKTNQVYLKQLWSNIHQLRQFSDISSSSSASSDDDELEDAVLQEEDPQSLTECLAEPEFSGLWDQDCKVPKTSATVRWKQILASF